LKFSYSVNLTNQDCHQVKLSTSQNLF
jgi:hypothetical protein